MNTHQQFELVRLKSGHLSLRSLSHNETFHPATGPFDEANVIHVAQARIAERVVESRDRFVIWDVGFGAAANVLAAIEALAKVELAGELRCDVEIHSFDRTTAPIEFALERHAELGYLSRHEEKVRSLLRDRRTRISPRIEWHLHLGDFSRLVFRPPGEPDAIPSPNAIFYDPYSPATNPEMWTLEHFERIVARIDPAQDCLFTNYTRSTSMRVALALAGFQVGIGCVIGEKAETTVAANRPGLLSAPLDRTWLNRVRASSNSAPLRGATYIKAPIADEDFARLGRSSQFGVSETPLRSTPSPTRFES